MLSYPVSCCAVLTTPLGRCRAACIPLQRHLSTVAGFRAVKKLQHTTGSQAVCLCVSSCQGPVCRPEPSRAVSRPSWCGCGVWGFGECSVPLAKNIHFASPCTFWVQLGSCQAPLQPLSSLGSSGACRYRCSSKMHAAWQSGSG